MINGRRLSGRYKLKGMIGGGGMANVYLAEDIILDRDVAIKVLRPDFSNDDEFIKRFHREAHSTTSLDHPNIVSIFDVGEEDDIYFFVMEYVDGQTLKQFIQQNGPVSVEETIRIMKQLTAAIEHAHQNQIVHRDIKPHNILIDEDGNVKVTDFGIAMALSATSITQTNSVLGSVHYLSPEQARGGMANKKSDVYSLGIVMFELLTGRLPFFGESAVSIALKHLQSETPSPRRWNPSIPQSVENIILKSTAKDPFHRYESVREMRGDLNTALDPNRLDEPKFEIPEDDEKTKAIPIITEQYVAENSEDTIVHAPEQQNGPSQPKKKKKRLIPIFLISTFAIIAFAMLAMFVLPSILKEKEIIIPDVSGEEVSQALATLQSLGLKVETIERNDAEIPEGYVIQTEPEANSAVKAGFEVVVYKSIGKEKINFDNYIGMQLEDAISSLKEKGIREDNIKAYPKESELPENEIVAQLQPKPNDIIHPDDLEDLTVFFEISRGPKVVIPDMSGWSKERVEQFVKENGIKLENVDEKIYSDQYDPGTVVEQHPDPSTEIKKGQNVEITLSKGAEPKKYTVTHVVPFDSSLGTEEQQVDIYVNDMDNDITNIFETVYITESKEISFEMKVPYNSEASFKIYRNGEFIVSDVVNYESIP